MGRVFKRTRKTYGQLAKLRNGRAYYNQAGTSGPFVKMGRLAVLATNSPPTATGTPAGTTVTNATVLIVDPAEGHYQLVR